MSNFFGNWLVCFALVFPTWVLGALHNMANASDLLWTAGFAAFLALMLRLSRERELAPARRRLHDS